MDQLDAIQAAKAAGASKQSLQKAFDLQRKAQWRLDFIAAENSMGFHAPQEAARVLGEAVDYARQGQVEALEAVEGAESASDRPQRSGPAASTFSKISLASPGE